MATDLEGFVSSDGRDDKIAGAIEHSTWHQNFLDQDLGPSVGRVVNDVSVGIAAGDMTPEDGAQQIQDAWDQR